MDIIMKPGEEVTGRIRWEQPVLTLYGYIAGETDLATFIVNCPGAADTSGPWVLTSALPGQHDWRLSGDHPGALRRAAEAWVAEFASSLGAIFPAALRADIQQERAAQDEHAAEHAEYGRTTESELCYRAVRVLDWVLAFMDRMEAGQ